MSLKNIFLKLLSHLPGGNELNIQTKRVCWQTTAAGPLSWHHFFVKSHKLISGSGTRRWIYSNELQLLHLTHWPLIHFKVNFKLILVLDDWGISCAILLIWMSLGFPDDKSTLVQVMAWCRQATSHYLNQCWPRFTSPYGVTRPQWVKAHLHHILDASLSLGAIKTTESVFHV